jgi:solute carrier family 25 protein 39/40
MAIPANVIYFAGYDWLRHSRRSPLAAQLPDTYAPLIAGALARISAATVISPVEMFRTRLQASSHHPTASSSSASSSAPRSLFTDTLKGLNDMVHTQGYTSLWRGLTLTLWRDVPFSGLYWWGYEAIRNTLTDMRHDSSIPSSAASLTGSSRSRTHSRSLESHSTTLADSFVAGAVSGAIAALLTTPFDVGKTRQQVLRHPGDVPAGVAGGSTGGMGGATLRPEDRSMPRFLWHIFSTEGVPGLWKGWAARCLKVAPACAIMISSYEVGMKMAWGANERREGRVAK